MVHDTSRPYSPENNGVAERAVRRVKEGTSAALYQSGLPDDWWGSAMTCYCFLRCVFDQLEDGVTPFERRFKAAFKVPIIPYGGRIEYKPSRDLDTQRLHPLTRKPYQASL